MQQYVLDHVDQGRLSAHVMRNEEVDFRSIAPLPSNVRAIEAALLFATGHQPFVALSGPSGCGKTLMLKAAQGYLRRHVRSDVEMMTAEQFLKMEGRVSLDRVLILDDCQEVLGKPKQYLRLRVALDRRIRGGRPTLLAFTCSGRDRRMMSFLPAPRKWCHEFIAEPDTNGRTSLTQHLAKQEKINLAPAFIKIIGSRLLGNGRVISGALRRIKLEKADWTDSHQVLRGCGLLDPFFADNSNWDLRHRIARASEDIVGKEPVFGSKGISKEDLACYMMIEVAGLCESAVANYLEMDPGTCYQRSQKVGRALKNDAGLSRLVHQCVESVLVRLA